VDPGRPFLAMLLEAGELRKAGFRSPQLFPDVPTESDVPAYVSYQNWIADF
jgi:hypothetical protein